MTLRIMAFLCLLPSISLAQTEFWHQTSGPLGGFVTGLAVSWNGNVFAKTTAGIYRSSNYGEEWIQVYSSGCNYLTIDSSGRIYLARGGRVIRSTDNGISWAQTTGTFAAYAFTIDVQRQEYLFAGTLGNGVFRSTDEGEHWTQINAGLPDQTQVWSISTNSLGHVYLGDGQARVFRSINNGNSWTQVFDAGLLNRVLTITFNHQGQIFLGTESGGVFRSSDDGVSWKSTMKGLTTSRTPWITISQNGSIFAGTYDSGVFRSTDNGENWSGMIAGLTNLNIGALVTDPSDYVFAGSGGGVFLSTNNGDNWSPRREGMRGSEILSLMVNAAGDLFAGTHYGGAFRSTNNGKDWTEINNGLTSTRIVAITPSPNGNFFAGGNRGVSRSSDNGDYWTELGGVQDEVTSLAVNSLGHIIAGTSANSMFRSTNNGDTWIHTYVGPPNNVTIYSLTVDSTNSFLAGTYSGLYRSSDSGENWTALNNGLTSPVLHSAIVNSLNIFVSTLQGKLYKTLDGGVNWSQVYIDSTNLPVGPVAVNSLGHIFIGVPTLGSLWSSNGGTTWTTIGLSLTDNYAACLALSRDGYLFAGTYGSGVFVSGQSTTGVSDWSDKTAETFGLLQNYPNPFNPSTTITYHLKEQGLVILTVFDRLGREITSLVNETKDPGSHSIRWESGNLAAGVYFFRLRSGTHALTRKAVLIK